MEEGIRREILREESDVKNAGTETTPKCAQLAHTATEEDFNRKDARLPTVVACGLAGDTLVLELCRTVGDIMAKIAMSRSIYADRVVVTNADDGQPLGAQDPAAPSVQFAIINEEDAVVDSESARSNLLLHAQQGDHVACPRLVAEFEALHRRPYWLTASQCTEEILCGIISRRDAEWATSVKTLIRAGISSGAAFLTAASTGFADCVALLLSIDPSLIGFEDNAMCMTLFVQIPSLHTALTLAACAGSKHGLVEKPHGRQIKHMEAADAGYYDVVVKLLAAKAEVNHMTSKWETALCHAADRGRSDMVDKLLAAGADVESKYSETNTPLICAARGGHYDVVVKLLAAGATVEPANKDGDTALICAASQGNADVVAHLLAAGADVEHANSDGDTALDVATSEGHTDVVAKLLAARTEIEQAN